jgi:hypothetical protein
MSFPGADNHAAFRFFFSEDTTSASKAESILELLFKIIRAINDNPEEKVQTIYNLPIDDELFVNDAPINPTKAARSSSQ